jgi:hypothetical protein
VNRIVSDKKLIYAYAIGAYFILSGIFAIAQTIDLRNGLSSFDIETVLFQLLGILAGGLLLLRKFAALYIFVFFFSIHLSGRFWALFIATETPIEPRAILYMGMLAGCYAGLAYYLFVLKGWGYYGAKTDT